MDLTPLELEELHRGYDALNTPPSSNGEAPVQHSTRKRPGI